MKRRRRRNPEVGRVSDVWRFATYVLAGYIVWQKFGPKLPVPPAGAP